MVSVALPDVGSQRHFHTQQKLNPNNVVVELRCITDGTVSEFIDEGPHPQMDGRPFPQWQTTPPSIGRSRILALLQKRDGAGNPLWYATKPGVRIWDRAITRFVDVPVYSDALAPVAEAHAQIRDDRAKAGRALLDAKKKEQAEQQAATEATVVNALGKLLGKAGADAAPAAKKGGAQ
jgi:hypothetical protein